MKSNPRKDSLLTEKSKAELTRLIESNDLTGAVRLLDSLSTSHAGTAKTRDKRLAAKLVTDAPGSDPGACFRNGSAIFNCGGDNAKEVGVTVVWRGYPHSPAQTLEIMLQAADDPNWEVREYAAGAFINALKQNPELYPEMIRLTKHESPNIRRAVLFSSLAFKEAKRLPKAFGIIEPLLKDRNEYVRRNLGPFILGSHFGIRFPEVTLQKLKQWSARKDAAAKWNIIMAFHSSYGHCHPDKAFEVLKRFADDSDRFVSGALKSVVKHIRKRHKQQAEDFCRLVNIPLK